MKFYHRQRFEDSSSLLLSHQFSLLSTCTDVAQIPNFLIGDGSKTPNTKLCPPTTAIIAGPAFSIQRSWQADNADGKGRVQSAVYQSLVEDRFVNYNIEGIIHEPDCSYRVS